MAERKDEVKRMFRRQILDGYLVAEGFISLVTTAAGTKNGRQILLGERCRAQMTRRPLQTLACAASSRHSCHVCTRAV